MMSQGLTSLRVSLVLKIDTQDMHIGVIDSSTKPAQSHSAQEHEITMGGI